MNMRRERRVFAIVTFSLIALTAIVSSLYLVFRDQDVKGVSQSREVVKYPTITNLMPTNGYVGEEYEFVPRISSDTESTVSILNGPEWLRIDQDGIVRGVPDSVGTFKVVLKVENTFGNSQSTSYIIIDENE